jgi:hypothetical protein
MAGRVLARERLSSAHTTGAVRVRRKRVVLTPGVCASRLAVVQRPDRARASVIGKTTGAIVHRSPGRARHKPSNHCAGKGRDVQAALYAAVHLPSRYLRTADRGCQPAPGLPCALSKEGRREKHRTRASCAARPQWFDCCCSKIAPRSRPGVRSLEGVSTWLPMSLFSGWCEPPREAVCKAKRKDTSAVLLLGRAPTSSGHPPAAPGEKAAIAMIRRGNPARRLVGTGPFRPGAHS